MLAFFEQPDVHAKILEYVQQKNLDIESLNEDELLRILNELELLDGIEGKFQEEHSQNQPLKDQTHCLTVTVTKGRKFRPFLDLERPSSFYFVLSGFSQKVRSSSYPTA